MPSELIAKLERADGPDRELDAEIAILSGWTVYTGDNWIGPHGAIAVPAYTASIDAAMTLYIHKPDVLSSDPRKVCADAIRQRNEILGQGAESGPQ